MSEVWAQLSPPALGESFAKESVENQSLILNYQNLAKIHLSPLCAALVKKPKAKDLAASLASVVNTVNARLSVVFKIVQNLKLFEKIKNFSNFLKFFQK